MTNSKCYIPTCTNNFNNILSTESISPELYYLKRNFGYKRFDKIEPNNFTNSILGYSKIPKFDLFFENYVNYPLIIEIDNDLIDSKNLHFHEESGLTIYKISQTIYLHPKKARFLFFQEEHLKACLIKAEPSIETKLVPFYHSRFHTIDLKKEKNVFQWKSSLLKNVQDIKVIDEKNILIDEKIDKLKGFYYSYFIGKLLSPDHKWKNVIKKFKEIDKLIMTFPSEKKDHLSSTIKNNEDLVLLLKNYHQDYEHVGLNFDIHFNHLLTVTFINDQIFKDKGADLFKNIINEMLDNNVLSIHDFKEQKVELAYRMGSILKDYIKNWNKSKERTYFNSLMDNLESYQPFDIKAHPNTILQSIAAFILKGEDHERLIEILTTNKIPNLEIALSMWGSIFGFSSFPKTLFHEFLLAKNIDLTSVFYKDAYNKIHEKSIENISIELRPVIQSKLQQRNIDTLRTDSGKTKSKAPSNSILKSEIEDSPLCPKCGNKMVEKNGPYGNFWGCTKFPNCKGSIPFKSNSIIQKNKELIEIISYYLKENGESRISEIIPVIKDRIKKQYTVTNIQSYIKENAPDQFEIETKNRAKVINFRENNIEF